MYVYAILSTAVLLWNTNHVNAENDITRFCKLVANDEKVWDFIACLSVYRETAILQNIEDCILNSTTIRPPPTYGVFFPHACTEMGHELQQWKNCFEEHYTEKKTSTYSVIDEVTVTVLSRDCVGITREKPSTTRRPKKPDTESRFSRQRQEQEDNRRVMQQNAANVAAILG